MDLIFFFKQKTAYEMRISDWSSDVCSSDLGAMTEAEFLAALRTLPLHPGAQGLRDDVAHLGDLILTTDTIVEGVHYLASETPADVAWKLVAVNLSDLAAKGAVPEGIMQIGRAHV